MKQGLTVDSGDVDLLGFEEGLSLKDRQNDLAETLNRFQISTGIRHLDKKQFLFIQEKNHTSKSF